MLHDAAGAPLRSESPTLGASVGGPDLPGAGRAVAFQSDRSLLVSAGATTVRYRSRDR